MEISPLNLSLLLLYSFVYGICIGVVNDINRIIRVFFGVRYTSINFERLYAFFKIKNKEKSDIEKTSKKEKIKNIYLNILIFIQDIFLSLFVATGIILLNYYFNDGRFRIFTVLAMALSATLYYFTVGKLTMLISEPIMIIVRTSVLFLIKTVSLPFRIILKWLYSLIKNTASKVKKHVAKRANIRYNKREVERLFVLSQRGFLDITDNRNYKENEKEYESKL